MPLALEAARLGVEEKLPLADSVVPATARRHNAILWTKVFQEGQIVLLLLLHPHVGALPGGVAQVRRGGGAFLLGLDLAGDFLRGRLFEFLQVLPLLVGGKNSLTG